MVKYVLKSIQDTKINERKLKALFAKSTGRRRGSKWLNHCSFVLVLPAPRPPHHSPLKRSEEQRSLMYMSKNLRWVNSCLSTVTGSHPIIWDQYRLKTLTTCNLQRWGENAIYARTRPFLIISHPPSTSKVTTFYCAWPFLPEQPVPPSLLGLP